MWDTTFLYFHSALATVSHQSLRIALLVLVLVLHFPIVSEDKFVRQSRELCDILTRGLNYERSRNLTFELALGKSSTTKNCEKAVHCCYRGAFQEVNILMNRAHLTNCKI